MSEVVGTYEDGFRDGLARIKDFLLDMRFLGRVTSPESMQAQIESFRDRAEQLLVEVGDVEFNI